MKMLLDALERRADNSSESRPRFRAYISYLGEMEKMFTETARDLWQSALQVSWPPSPMEPLPPGAPDGPLCFPILRLPLSGEEKNHIWQQVKTNWQPTFSFPAHLEETVTSACHSVSGLKIEERLLFILESFELEKVASSPKYRLAVFIKGGTPPEQGAGDEN